MSDQHPDGGHPTVAELHRRHAEHFTAIANGVSDWDAPTPVKEWAARDIIRHLTTWLPEFVRSAAGVTLPPGPPVDIDPVGSWTAQAVAVQELLEDPATHQKQTDHPHQPPQPLDQALAQIYLNDVFLHTWDLARASGQDDTLDEALCAQMVDGMAAIEDIMRGSGQFGPRVPVPDDASAQDRLIGFIGRDPHWRPPAGVAT